MTAEKGGQRKGAKREGKKATPGEAELLDLAGTIVGLARDELNRRNDDHRTRCERSRAILYRAQEGADAESRPVLEETFARLEADEGVAADLHEAKTTVLDDLAHDLAAVAARLKQAPG